MRRHSFPNSMKTQSIEYPKKKNKKLIKVNQYVFVKKIGLGASSKVYLCYDTTKQQFFAGKRIRLNEICRIGTRVQQVEREIKMLRKLEHNNIISMVEALYSKENSLACIIQDWADCGSLDSVLKTGRHFTEGQLATIFSQVVNGLLYLHSTGNAHRDIKPSNVLLLSNGTVKIGDLGIGHSFQSADAVVGSPAYQAPEMFGYSDDEDYEEEESCLDPIKEDVWSLGVTLFESIFGRIPFSGTNAYEVAKSARENQLTFDFSISEDLSDLLKGMLNLNPERRLSMDEVSRHSFFGKAVPKAELALPKPSYPIISAESEMQNIVADVCDEEYSFMQSDIIPSFTLTLPQRALSRS